MISSNPQLLSSSLLLGELVEPLDSLILYDNIKKDSVGQGEKVEGQRM